MDPVGDGINPVARKHQARHFSVLLGYSIDVPAHVESQVGHVQHALTIGERFRRRTALPASKNARRYVAGKGIGKIFLMS